MKKMLLLFSVLLFIINTASAEILSQWRGPERTGVYPESGLLKQWPKSGPKLLWKFEKLGNGHASPAVTTNRIYINGETDGISTMFAFDLQGKLLWESAYGSEFIESYEGPRSIPTIDDNRIYITSGKGVLYCLSTENGKVQWSVDFLKEFSGENIRWGIAESPLVYDNKVIVTPGGSKALVAALDKMTGKVLWACTDMNELSSYCSPNLINHNGKRLLLTMTQTSIVCLDPDTGKLLWRKEHRTRYDIQPNTPFYKDGFVFNSTGYSSTSFMLKLSADGSSAKELWNNEDLDSQFHSYIVLGNYIYGSSHSKRHWCCIDWTTGETLWTSKELSGPGNIILADGLFYCYTEKGDFALVKPDSKGLNIISQFEITLGSKQHWAHSVIRDKRLYVRHGNALMVYSIAE